MIRLIDLSFHVSNHNLSPPGLIEKYKSSYGYLDYLDKRMDVEVIFHDSTEQTTTKNDTRCTILTGKNGFFRIPFKTLRYIRKQSPDIVLVQGLLFPVQVIALGAFLAGKNCPIIVQHHKETPYDNFFMRTSQKIANLFVTKYLFTSKDNLYKWKTIIKPDKVNEVLEGSTSFQPLNKGTSKRQLKITGDNIFLWVGRLDNNKDPLCVLQGFSRYLDSGGKGELYMIYQTEDLLSEVKHFVEHDKFNNHIHLIGTVEHENLPLWLSASDYFILGSHYEGSGYALIEAMACGCIPVVTDIPPFRKITGDGKHGILFQPGNSNHFVEKLNSLHTSNKEIFSKQITQHFQANLSFKKIADDLYELCKRLTKH